MPATESIIGVHPGTSRAKYDAIDAMNVSTLLHGLKSMAHLKYRLDHIVTETSEDLDIGTATHLAVFEPAEFEKRVILAPDCGRRSNADKQRWAEFEAMLKPSEVALSVANKQKVVAMRDALHRNEHVHEILQAKGSGEMTAVWQDAETGILCKGLVDRFCEWQGWPLVPDLKTCPDARKEEFSRSVARHSYHVRAAWYLDGLNSIAPADRRFCWIAVEKEPPHVCALFEPDGATVAEGRKVYRRLLDAYAHCKAKDEWPGYTGIGGLEPLRLPKWAFEREEFE